MATNVHVVTGNASVIKMILQKIPQGTPCFWIYLGKDVQKCNYLESIIDERAKRKLISDTLQDYARTCRQEYIDYIGRLSNECHNPLWPLTTLAEKNPFVSDFYLFFCYLKTGLKFIQQIQGNLIVVCEARSLFDAFRENLESSSQQNEISFTDSASERLVERVTLPLIGLRNKLVFLVRYQLRVFLAIIFSRLKRHSLITDSGKSALVMHSWADSRAFPKKTEYQEIYLGCLAGEMERANPDFMYLVHVLPTIGYVQALRNLLQVDKNIYLVEEFLAPGDIIRSFIHVKRNYPVYPQTWRMGDVNVSSLIIHDYQTDAFSSRIEQIYLNYYISQALQRRFQVRAFIYPFENHIWEKAFCMGFRNCAGLKTYAYAIIFINPLYTCYSVSKHEKGKTYLPDLIFVSGRQGKEMLSESGFDREKIIVGGAIRYPNINTSEDIQKTSAQSTILVILGPSVNQSLEILFSVVPAFRDTHEFSIIIKCHPIVPFRSLSPYLAKLPGNFRVADQSVEELLGMSSLVLYADSTVCLEALAHGIPVLHLDSNFTIDTNILEGVDFVPTASSPEEIRAKAIHLLRSGKIPKERVREVIGHLFAPVDIEMIKSVLSPKDNP